MAYHESLYLEPASHLGNAPCENSELLILYRDAEVQRYENERKYVVGSIARSGKRLAKKGLKLLPESLRLKVIQNYVSGKEKTLSERTMPDALTLFVTTRCNARCDHCFYWKELNTEHSELTLEEIDKIAASIEGGLGSIALTGGEPSLRRDLGEICQIFNERCQTRYVGIASNGLLPERMRGICEWILEHCELERLSVQISLDGLEDVHNEIRKVPQAFAKAMESIKLLSQLQRERKNFSVNTALTVQPRNYHGITDFVESLLPLNVEMKFLIVRGSNYGTYRLNPIISSEFDPKVKESASVSLHIEQLEELYTRLKELNEKAEVEFWSELEQAKMHTTLRILEEKKRVIPCYAGYLEGVIYSNGDVAVCELTRPFGNLRKSGYDLYELWNSDAANWMRSRTRTCACIHDCNLTTGLRFEPEILYSTVMGNSLKKREQRWRIRE